MLFPHKHIVISTTDHSVHEIKNHYTAEMSKIQRETREKRQLLLDTASAVARATGIYTK